MMDCGLKCSFVSFNLIEACNYYNRFWENQLRNIYILEQFLISMDQSLHSFSFREFSNSAGPTSTEICRIRYTIDNLNRNCFDLEQKIRNCLSVNDPLIKRHLIHQATEIFWGWENLKQILNDLNDDVINKHSWISDCDKGLIQITKIMLQINQYFPERLYRQDGLSGLDLL